MEKVPNPAVWLGNIWDRMPPPSQATSLSEWARTFQLDPNDVRVFDGLQAFIFMAGRTQQAVSDLNLPEKIKRAHLSWTSAFSEVMQQAVGNGAWSNSRHRFTAVARSQLQTCELWLDQICASSEETSGEFEQILEELDNLRASVQDADVEEDFKILLLDIIESMRRAISEYDIRGGVGVQQALGEILGHALRRTDLVARNAKGDLLARAGKVLKRVAFVGGVIKGGAEIYLILQKIFLPAG